MINKQVFKLFVGMLALLMGLTGCFTLKKEEATGQKSVRLPEKEVLEESKPITYLIVGFAGLTDPGTHPADWLDRIQKMIADKTATSTNKPIIHTLLIKRSSENKTVQEHADEAKQAILEDLLDKEVEDLNNVKLILIAESYGGLVAAQLALRNSLSDVGISIAGLVTIRTPWEGVSLVQAISMFARLPQQLKPMIPDMANMIDSYNTCQRALGTLDPSGSFIQGLKTNGLRTLKFPILALGGKDTQATFPYAGLQIIPMLALMMPQLTEVVSQVSPLLAPYPSGNDGLVLTSSAIAATSSKGTNFESHVLSGFPHFGNTVNHPEALGHVKSFIDRIS